MEELYPRINKGVQPGSRGKFSRNAPAKEVTWHHHAEIEGLLQLVPRKQHQAKGPIQKILHPEGRGGMENWGGGRYSMEELVIGRLIELRNVLVNAVDFNWEDSLFLPSSEVWSLSSKCYLFNLDDLEDDEELPKFAIDNDFKFVSDRKSVV